MVKLFSGSFVNSGMGNGREQFNINEKHIIDGNYYGVILNAGAWYDVSLEKIDDAADRVTDKIDGVLLIYFEEIENAKCIVAIAENTTVYRKMQEDEGIVKNRIHDYEYEGESVTETVGYHTITAVEDMHLLKENYIPIHIPKECGYFFRAQRALSKDEKYRALRRRIIDKALDFLNDSELDLQPKQIENADIVHGKDGSDEPLSICSSSNGNQINKKPWVSKNALAKAGYLCEYDPNHKTFFTNKGHAFMEGHHLIRCTVKISREFMARHQKNIDTESNIVSLCPNCHRRIHYGNPDEKTEMIEHLYKIKREELHKSGLMIELDALKGIYDI
jgi:5-methylcytosine-specific restriction protein A